MILPALSFITNELNEYFRTAFQLAKTDSRAVLSAHVSADGSVVTDIINKISVTLINLEPESTVRNALPDRSGAGEQVRLNPPIRLNLRVLFAANFENYEESLKFLGSTLAFFQGHGLFTPQNAPALDAGIDRLIVELEPTTYQEWSYLWGMLGVKYMPGVVYKIRMLTIQEGTAQGSTAGVTTLGVGH